MTAAMPETSVLPLDTHAAYLRLVRAGASGDMAQAIVDMHVGILSTGLATRTAVHRVQERVDQLHEHVDQLRGHVDHLNEHTNARIDHLREHTDGRIDHLREHTDNRIDRLETTLSRDIVSAKLSLVLWFVGGNVVLLALLSLMVVILQGIV